MVMTLISVVSACHSSPPTYQPPDRSRKPEPKQAAVANMQMAIEYMRLNNLAQARERIERALDEAPENPNVQETAGLVYERLNEMPKAQRAFSTAARLGKEDPAIQNSYAGFLCRTGKTAAGEKLFVQVARNPAYQTPEVALLNAGVCVGAAGDAVDADRYFNRALAIRPNMPEALLQLGNLAYDRGDSAQALEPRAAIPGGESTHPRDPLAWVSRGTQAGRQHRGRGLCPSRAVRISRFRPGTIDALRRRAMSEVGQTLGERLKTERERRGLSHAKGRRRDASGRLGHRGARSG